MKSSTIIRSNLTKEAMDVIETLSNESYDDIKENVSSSEELPEEYYRHEDSDSKDSKEHEIDLLWQNFKTAQFNTQSPATYITIGFICGVITSIIVAAILGYFMSKPDISIPKIDFSKFNISKSHETMTNDTDVETQTSAKIVVPTEDDTPAVVEGNSQESVSEPESNQTETSNVITSNVSNSTRQHTVKDGETVEAIIKHYYGSYTPERAEKIKQANNLKTLDRINIDQVLIIPQE